MIQKIGRRGFLAGTLSLLAFSACAEPARLDIDAYRETFSDDFRGSLDVSPRGPGTRWIAHTPWNGDFGDAKFVDPSPGFPFVTGPDGLRIEVRKGADGKWQGGLLSGHDFDGHGFSQAYGYFEARMKMPPGPGVWPAFWLITEKSSPEKGEMDIVEYYGRQPDRYSATMHVWPKEKNGTSLHDTRKIVTSNAAPAEGFHLYGASIDPEETVVYFDRVEVVRFKTPPVFASPVYMLLNLTLGPGWPIDKTPNPSFLYVDYVKAFARR